MEIRRRDEDPDGQASAGATVGKREEGCMNGALPGWMRGPGPTRRCGCVVLVTRIGGCVLARREGVDAWSLRREGMDVWSLPRREWLDE